MPDANAAAVEAMAAALHRDCGCGDFASHSDRVRETYLVKASGLVAALVRSEAVRAAGYELAQAMWDDEPSRQRGMSAISHFLAALAPPEAT